MISASVTSRSGPFSRATNCTCIVLLLALASSSAPPWNGRGAFGLAVRGVHRKRLPSTSPRLAETPGGRRRDSGTTAEGPPHVRRDDGAETTSRRASRSAAEGTPKGLARPRSDSAPEEHPSGFEGDGQAKLRAAERPRDATTCARGEATNG